MIWASQVFNRDRTGTFSHTRRFRGKRGVVQDPLHACYVVLCLCCLTHSPA